MRVKVVDLNDDYSFIVDGDKNEIFQKLFDWFIGYGEIDKDFLEKFFEMIERELDVEILPDGWF